MVAKKRNNCGSARRRARHGHHGLRHGPQPDLGGAARRRYGIARRRRWRRLRAAGAFRRRLPEEAVRDARMVITMLPSDEVVNAVVFDGTWSKALGGVPSGRRWARLAWRRRPARPSARPELRPDVMFVDAPVSGSKGPATSGQLLILASGPPEAEEILEPAFRAVGQQDGVARGARARAAG